MLLLLLGGGGGTSGSLRLRSVLRVSIMRMMLPVRLMVWVALVGEDVLLHGRFGAETQQASPMRLSQGGKNRERGETRTWRGKDLTAC